jgi:hypothetical protein
LVVLTLALHCVPASVMFSLSEVIRDGGRGSASYRLKPLNPKSTIVDAVVHSLLSRRGIRVTSESWCCNCSLLVFFSAIKWLADFFSLIGIIDRRLSEVLVSQGMRVYLRSVFDRRIGASCQARPAVFRVVF